MDMTTTLAPSMACGVRARSTGKPCTHRAGYGTSHVGFGHCKFHGGATPSGTKAAAKLMLAYEAREVVRANPAPPAGAPQSEVLRWLTALVAGQLQVVREQVAVVPFSEMFDKRGQPNPWITLQSDLMDIGARLAITQIRHREALKSYEIALNDHQRQIVYDLVNSAVDAAGLNAEQRKAFAASLRESISGEA